MKNETQATGETSLCETCIHRVYCACVGKTGYCGNYTDRAARVRDGRWEPHRPAGVDPRSRHQRPQAAKPGSRCG